MQQALKSLRLTTPESPAEMARMLTAGLRKPGVDLVAELRRICAQGPMLDEQAREGIKSIRNKVDAIIKACSEGNRLSPSELASLIETYRAAEEDFRAQLKEILALFHATREHVVRIAPVHTELAAGAEQVLSGVLRRYIEAIQEIRWQLTALEFELFPADDPVEVKTSEELRRLLSDNG